MPLHDWDELTGWDGVRHFWITNSFHWIRPRLPPEYALTSVLFRPYLSYLQAGAHLLLVDVHRRPLTFSFADALERELQISMPAAYWVGEPAPQGGRFVAIWRRALTVGQPLPKMPLPLTVQASISVDLEDTYRRAASDAYLT